MTQDFVHRYTEELFGKEFVFKAGTVSGLQDKTAYGYIKENLEERGRIVNRAGENGWPGLHRRWKASAGQHHGGVGGCAGCAQDPGFLSHPAPRRPR